MKKQIQKSIGAYFNTMSLIYPKIVARKGFELFCKPMSSPVKKHQKAFLDTGMSTVLEYENQKIQTYKWGSGTKKILLVHGWASHSFRWKAYINYLTANDFTVYAFDAPAHGLSEGKRLHIFSYSNVIDGFMKQTTGIEYIISHSIAGFFTLYWLFQHPDNPIKKVVIMGAPGEAKDFFNFYQKVLGLTDRTLSIIKNEFISSLHHKLEYFSAQKFAQQVATQSLIIHDKEDQDTDYKNSVRLHENWKNSKLILTKGLGHGLKSKKLQKEVFDFVMQ
jgi:esterase/lipase